VTGIIVDHKETGIRYAISEVNFNPKTQTKVRGLNPGETVLGYKPRLKDSHSTPAVVTPKAEVTSPEAAKATK
jgi:hypothetical protein